MLYGVQEWAGDHDERSRLYVLKNSVVAIVSMLPTEVLTGRTHHFPAICFELKWFRLLWQLQRQTRKDKYGLDG